MSHLVCSAYIIIGIQSHFSDNKLVKLKKKTIFISLIRIIYLPVLVHYNE